MRDTTGTGAVPLNMGTGSGTSGVVADVSGGNVFDVSSHNADLLFDTVILGSQNRGAGTINALSFDQGFMVMNNLTMAVRPLDSSSGAGTPTLNLGTNSRLGFTLTGDLVAWKYGDALNLIDWTGVVATNGNTVNLPATST